MKFYEYIVDWYKDFVNNKCNDEATMLMDMGVKPARLQEIPRTSYHELLMSFAVNGHAGIIYDRLIGHGMFERKRKGKYYQPEDFHNEMFQAALGEDFMQKYEFVEEVCIDLAAVQSGYCQCKAGLYDVVRYGCKSGLPSIFVYKEFCYDFYEQYYESMDRFVDDLRKSGYTIENTDLYPYPIFICWFCYEEIARQLTEIL